MTIVVFVEDLPLETGHQAAHSSSTVLKIVELDPRSPVPAGAAAASRCGRTIQTRSHVLETVQLFRAKVVDVTDRHRHRRGHRTADKLDALIRVLEQFGIRRTRPVPARRQSAPATRSMTDRALRSA